MQWMVMRSYVSKMYCMLVKNADRLIRSSTCEVRSVNATLGFLDTSRSVNTNVRSLSDVTYADEGLVIDVDKVGAAGVLPVTCVGDHIALLRIQHDQAEYTRRRGFALHAACQPTLHHWNGHRADLRQKIPHAEV